MCLANLLGNGRGSLLVPHSVLGVGSLLRVEDCVLFSRALYPTVMLSDEHVCPLGVNLFKIQSLSLYALDLLSWKLRAGSNAPFS